MRIVFVRHGEPDYANDCLTALGREQAKAAALRGWRAEKIINDMCRDSWRWGRNSRAL